jgi:hypothetical protein
MEALKPLIGRTKEEFDEYLKNDLLISIMKGIMQGIFGGIWIFLLFTTITAAYHFGRDLLRELPKAELDRKYRYFKKNDTRVKLVIFMAIQLLSTAILLCLPIGRTILSNGVVVFALAYIVYINWPASKQKQDEYQLERDLLSLQNKSNEQDFSDFEPVVIGGAVPTEESGSQPNNRTKETEKAKKRKGNKLKAN